MARSHRYGLGVAVEALLASVTVGAWAQNAASPTAGQMAAAPREAALAVPSVDDLRPLAGELAVLDGDALGARLHGLFAPAAGDAEATAAFAVALIQALDGDPEVVATLADAIFTAASDAMAAVPVYRIAVDPAFRLSAGAAGWDFGAADAPLYPGFRRMTPAALGESVAGTGLKRPAGDGLLSDGVAGITRLSIPATNGAYRLILLTDDVGAGAGGDAPLGDAIRVNGVTVTLARPEAERWVERGVLVRPDLKSAVLDGARLPAGGPGGGAVMLPVDIVDGRLAIAFPTVGSGGAYIAGLILEPISRPSALVVPAFGAAPALRLAAESRVADAVGRVFDALASAAGNAGDRQRLVNFAQPPVRDPTAASES